MLAAERTQGQMERDVLLGAMRSVSPEVQAQADSQWNRMKLQYADRVVLPRAQVRYERETRRLRNSVQVDPTMSAWIAGLTPPNIEEAMIAPDYPTAPRLGPTGSASRLLGRMDQVAEETILRPRRGHDGRVITGPLKVHYRPAATANRP